MRTTIFVRILVSSLLPVFLVLLIVIATAYNVVYWDGTAYTREIVRLTARQISEQSIVGLQNLSDIQDDFGKQMADVDFGRPGAEKTLDALLAALMHSSRNLYNAWFAFEPGLFSGAGRYYKSMVRTGEGIRAIGDMSEEQLADPDASPWYNIPLSTGEPYANIDILYDFRLGEGPIHVFDMVRPIVSADGRVIGCLGLALRFEDIFSESKFLGDEMQRIMVTTIDGHILYSNDEHDVGNILWDYGFKNVSAVSQAMDGMNEWQEEIKSPLSHDCVLVSLYPFEIDYKGRTVYLYRETSASSTYSTFSSSMEIIVVTGVLGMILLVFFVFYSTRGIVRNIKRITESFNLVAGGNADVTLSGEHIPTYETNIMELDILQSALVRMMIQLRTAHGLRLKALETEVEREKLIASAQAKTNFFATMSHEIRTPMNAILGISEIMLHEGDLAPSQEKYIRDIKISSDALLNIINDILDISKLETGKMELHPEHYNFQSLIDNITSLSTQLAMSANLQFIFKPDGALPLCLYGDGIRLRQVLLNLIGNAVKFTKSGYVLLRTCIEGDRMRFDVVDTGIGIKEEEIDYVFESFKRIDTRRNREVKGTGLGLSISKNLVELMGGTISVESIHGKGSTFRVTLPMILGDEKKLHHVKRSARTQYADSLRVLIVDDNEINLNVSSGLFKAAHGIQCDTAKSGQEAVEKIRNTDYDIIFMDHMMPEMDGLDTTQYIRGMGGKYEKVPIIALTANAVIGTKRELLEGGMDDFLAKPIQSDKLQTILDAWVPEDKRLPPPEETKEEPARETAEPQAEVSYNLPFEGLLEKEGINARIGLENIGFNEEMYTQSLRLLKDKLPQSMLMLNDTLERRNMKEFRIHIHGIKGSLASIGAALLAEDAKTLEEAAAQEDGDNCATLLPPLCEKLWDLRKTLAKALPDAENFRRKAVFDREQWEVSLQDLCHALGRYDYDAVVNEMERVLSMAPDEQNGNTLTQAKLLIDGFDYAGAAALIREMMEGGKGAEQE